MTLNPNPVYYFEVNCCTAPTLPYSKVVITDRFSSLAIPIIIKMNILKWTLLRLARFDLTIFLLVVGIAGLINLCPTLMNCSSDLAPYVTLKLTLTFKI